ncbi:MAG: globin domain-containing protein [Hyphomicrobiaceae bacterium]
MTDNYDDLQQSYGRCLRGKNFIERFYEIFLSSHPDIAPMFAETDFQKQRMALRRGITAAISHAAGSSLTKRTIDQMADTHSRKGHAPVPPELYRFWVASLVQAVSEMDPEATPALIARWRQGMGAVVDTFVAHY